MASIHPRSDGRLRAAQPDHAHGSAPVVTVDRPVPAYTCSVCGSSWHYREVRNTGRCPSCGSGLLRDPDWP